MRVRVLGQLAVTDDEGGNLSGEELPRRARQVLAVLAARYGKIQSKDALADAVWGDKPPGNSVAALEHYVSVIRRRFQPDGTAATWFIVTRSGGYLFDTARASLDLADLRCRIRTLDAMAPDAPERLGLHEEILGLAGELPFPEDPYADWAEAARHEVQVAAVNSLLAVATAALSSDPARAFRMAQQAIGLDPYLEAAYSTAMSASAALGRPDDALRLYERYRRILDEDLAVEPSSTLTTLHRSILSSRHTVPAPAPAGAPAPRPMTPPPPRERFVGRIAMLTLLRDQPQGAVVHVVGPVGAGKTAFLHEMGRHAPRNVGIGHGPSSAGPLRLAWLRSALAGLEVGPDVLAAADGDQPLTRDQLDLIATAFTGDDLRWIAVDDAGDLDATSVTELAWLSRHCPALRIMLTYDYPSQIIGRPVAALSTSIVLRLSTLSADDLEPFGGGETHARTGGIPALVAVADQPVETAHSVAMQIARERTRWMPAPAWEILRLCAALGPLRPDELAVLVTRPVAEVLTAVDGLVHAHLLAEEPDGRVRHRSALIRDAVAEQVSGATARYLREQLATVPAAS